jgi:hypothetical protein
MVKFLSSSANHTREASQRTQTALNQHLSALTRPGIAVDVSKVRDLVVDAAKLFDFCDPATTRKGN